MPKATITFNLPEERDEFDTAVNAGKYRSALFEIAQRIFRPARKHGYGGGIQPLLIEADKVLVVMPSEDGGYEGHAGTELVSALEGLFYEILREKGIEL